MPCRTRNRGLDVEGLGIVYLEASASGLPVVAGDSGGAPDAVLAGETGYVVPGRDVAEVADRVSELLLTRTLAGGDGRGAVGPGSRRAGAGTRRPPAWPSCWRRSRTGRPADRQSRTAELAAQRVT